MLKLRPAKMLFFANCEAKTRKIVSEGQSGYLLMGRLLMLGGDEAFGGLGAFAEEVLLHLVFHDFL
jgi:hypothetical protein